MASIVPVPSPNYPNKYPVLFDLFQSQADITQDIVDSNNFTNLNILVKDYHQSPALLEVLTAYLPYFTLIARKKYNSLLEQEIYIIDCIIKQRELRQEANVKLAISCLL